MKRIFLVMFILVIFVATVFSYKIGLSLSTLNNPFFVALRDGAIDKAKELGIELIIVDAQDRPSKQLNDIEDLVQQRVDLIIINPTDSDAIVAAVEEANDAKIPVITVDRGSNGGKVVVHIASDNVFGGAMAAKFIAEKLNGKGKVVELVGIPGTSAARDRGLGFETELKKYPGLVLVAKQTANFNRAEGLTVMENLLEAYPDIDAVFAQNDEMALGAIEAIKAAGKLDDIIVVGFDAIPDAIEAVKKGEMAATIAQQPYLMGQLAIQKAFKFLETQTVYIPVELKLVTE
ncbi:MULTISPECIES: ribose ABC transporter substrate-binding protein RbsB [unclassified Thermosipho (in: thermotogales)]|uniref:ribose ABC transporter substrate-binding protein RbsB n=1 Tax=unclassified Thermosipho (in: thermotogales) TaxID=2676525 RepID=UPI0009865033|nr:MULTISPECIES: ribose ABC transporter substrate-binding protein RbsB [unclassified Thermosipho (in: thermotogales)]MBT1247020.1 D-ribose ABC transporter substrate-binding protein [Thermosipho sp. 1244]OOC47042.1 D-ribose transporter subunit RbsB [Thermosipho sp. 1223]